MSKIHFSAEPIGYYGGGVPLKWRTCCGLVLRTFAGEGEAQVSSSPDHITCKRCRRSADWASADYHQRILREAADMTPTCDHCGREYYNASGCECILVGAAPLNTTATEVNAMKAALNDPGPRPNDPSPPPNCGDGGCVFRPPSATGQHTNAGCRCLPLRMTPSERVALRGKIRAVVLEADELRQTIRDLAIALLMDPEASPADVLRKTRLVMAERMEMQAGAKPHG